MTAKDSQEVVAGRETRKKLLSSLIARRELLSCHIAQPFSLFF
jgi:hypothetical protein